MRTAIHNHPFLQLFELVHRRFAEVRGMQTAGSLTYTTLLSLVPMITVVLTVMRQFSPFMKLGEGLRVFLLQNLLPEKAGRVVATYALQFSEKASSLTVVGTIFLVVTAIMLFATIDRTINSIWAIRKPRPWYVRIPIYWLMLTLGPVIFAAGIAATSDLLRSTLVQSSGVGRGLADRAGSALLLSALFSFLFHTVPNRRLRIVHAVAGGLVAGIGVVLAQRLFGFYLAKLPNFTLIYGTFSVLPIFLIWVYLTWLVILIGATVAAVLPEYFSRRQMLPDTPAGRLLAALDLAQALTLAQESGGSCSVETLARECRQAPAQVERMLEALCATGFVASTEEGGWLLTVHAQRLSLGELVASVVIGITPAMLQGGGLAAADRARLAQVVEALRDGLVAPLEPVPGA